MILLSEIGSITSGLFEGLPLIISWSCWLSSKGFGNLKTKTISKKWIRYRKKYAFIYQKLNTYSCSNCCSGDNNSVWLMGRPFGSFGETFGGAVLKSLSTKWQSPSIELRVSQTTDGSLRKPWSVTNKNISYREKDNSISPYKNTYFFNVNIHHKDLHFCVCKE